MACLLLQVHQSIQHNAADYTFVMPNWNQLMASYRGLHAYIFMESVPGTATINSCTIVGLTAAAIGSVRVHEGVAYQLLQTALNGEQTDKPVVVISLTAPSDIRIRVVVIALDPNAESIVANKSVNL